MNLKKISEIFTFSVPFLILCSCISLVTYYSHWDIPIFDYLSASELLFLFLRPALTFVLFAAIYLGINLVVVAVITPFAIWRVERKQKNEPKKKESKKVAEKSESKITKKHPILTWIIGIVFIAVITLTFANGIWFEYEIFPVVLSHMGLWLAAVLIVHRVSASRDDKVSGSRNRKISMETFFAGTIVMLISASFFYGRYQVHYTVTNPVAHKIVLTDSSVIETDSNLIYLGKTSSYYFFYNNAENQAVIIPVGEARATYIKHGN